MPDPLGFLEGELDALRTADLFRDPASSRCTPELLNICSNDYLGYAAEPWPASSSAPGGAGAARMLGGTHRAHDAAEGCIARWVGCGSALLYSSGYAANVGLISALAGPGDLIVSDALNHASIIDGCRLSRAAVTVVPHRDLAAVARALAAPARRRFVVVESLFSMEGDSPDLPGLRSLCDHEGAALLVDEAHALGTLGPEGAGLCAASGVRADALVGTLGKAIGLQGAFVAGSAHLRDWLWNRSRSFVFSTGVSPALAVAVEARVARVRADVAGRRRLDDCAGWIRQALNANAVATGPIIPWLLGSPVSALRVSEYLRGEGLLARAIRPPTVPTGSSRLRLTASAALAPADVERVVAALRRARQRFT